VEPLCQDELVVIVSPEHPWARRQHVRWADLATQVLITYYKASETFHMVQHELHARGITVRETMEVRHGAAVVEMVKVGLGIALMPRWVIRDELHSGTLCALPMGRGGLKRRWVIAYAKGAPLTAYGMAFMQLCHKWFPPAMTTSDNDLSAAAVLVPQAG
jgi:DNA-binding transcriptional LysR family regulator